MQDPAELPGPGGDPRKPDRIPEAPDHRAGPLSPSHAASGKPAAGDTSLTGAVARIMQSLRAERGWSLDHLASRSGVSKGVLVALEQGRSNPNLATLARIADAFGVPVTRLVDVSGEPVVRITGPEQARVLWRGEAGGTGTIIAATEPPWAAELWRWTLHPGERFGGDPHTPASKEMTWVESGTMTLTVAGRRYEVAAPRCARFPGSLPHFYANEGAEPAVLTMIVVVPPASS
jgi:transcriptional regulator with XRE-family HTH domain